MWKIENPKFEEITLDFSSSEQGKFPATRLVSEGVEIINAIELIEWEDNVIQVFVCDHCGTVRCASGGWITLRSSGDLVLLMPAYEAMNEDSWSQTEFSPPYFIRKNGAAYFDKQIYESLREQITELPKFEKIKPLQMREAMWLVQLNAPLQILGEPSTLEIDRRKFDFAVGASEGEAKEIIKEAEQLLRANFENQSSAYLRRLSQNEESIWLFLDAAEFIDWQVVTLSPGKYKFVLDNEFVIENGDFPNSD